ncbi:unnamed protein product [Rotaria socialis]
MDGYIQQLTHDNLLFENQWSKTLNQQIQFIDDLKKCNDDSLTLKLNSLNAIIDYVLNEQSTKVEPISYKYEFVEMIIKQCCGDPRPSLEFIVHNLLRILETNNIFDRWHLACIKTHYYEFRLGAWLLMEPSIDLIESIFRGLQIHSFLNDEVDQQVQVQWEEFLSEKIFSKFSDNSNRLNEEEAMFAIRSSFQQLFRHAARMSHRSCVWSKVLSILSHTLPTLFDHYDDLNDSHVDLLECVMLPISPEYIDLLSQSYKRNFELFKINLSQILIVIEKLLLTDHIEEAEKFFFQNILDHINAEVDIDALVRMFIRVCPLINIHCRNQLCKGILRSLTDKLRESNCSIELATLLFEFALILLDLHANEAPASAWNILNKSEFYHWQELAPRFADLVRLCVSYDIIDQKHYSNELDKLETILKLAADKVKVYPTILKATHAEALQAILRWSESMQNGMEKVPWPAHVYKMGLPALDLIDNQHLTTDTCTQLIVVLQQKVIVNEKYSNQQSTLPFIERFFTCLTQHLSIFIEFCKILPHEVHKQLATLCLSAIIRPLKHENGQISFDYNIVLTLWHSICQSLTNESDAGLYEKFLKRIHLLAHEKNDPILFGLWDLFWNSIGTKMISIAVNYVDEFLINIIDHKQFGQASLLPMLYLKQSQSFHDRFDNLIKAFFNTDTSCILSLAQLLWIITKTHPELITSAQVDRLFASTKYHTGTTNELTLIFGVLAVITNTRPHLLNNYHDLLVHFVNEQKNASNFDCLQEYFVASTIVGGEKAAYDSLTVLIDCLKSDIQITNDTRPQIVYICQLIGILNEQALRHKRKDFLIFNSYPECRILLDFIDGRIVYRNKESSIKQIREQVARIEKRLFKAKYDVQYIMKMFKSEELNVINHDTFFYEKTVNFLSTNWGHEVIKLLNVPADNDWNLLGQHFGYSTSELRHLALKVNPSMILLNEWFMTHNGEEAIYGLAKILDEIGRQDVTKVIREAISASGEDTHDYLNLEIQRFPPIFLSYYYSRNQNLVPALQHRLEKAGYACWMKNDQTTTLQTFIKRDSAIRGAKILICCMNTSYIHSDECLHEIQLIVNTGKPLIIWHMENQMWSSESAFEQIIGRYPYSSFYINESNSENDLPAGKFVELLGRIRYYVAPNPDMISEQYYNWFVPQIDNLIFLQPISNGGKNYKTILKNNIPFVINEAQIVISYEWDRQADIIALYKRLTQFGYRCWLDIFQMDGVDSLLKKISTGIRSAKCVLACVTQKFTKSINCRREMSLADTLSKPIVPLLLEETNRWPPIGPMSLIFAETTYFDFCSSHKSLDIVGNDIWSGEQFEKLLSHLTEIVPEAEVKMSRRHTLVTNWTTTPNRPVDDEKKTARLQSAPTVPKSRACSIM